MSHKLKITLEDSEPKIYRTIIVPEKFTFDGFASCNIMRYELGELS